MKPSITLRMGSLASAVPSLLVVAGAGFAGPANAQLTPTPVLPLLDPGRFEVPGPNERRISPAELPDILETTPPETPPGPLYTLPEGAAAVEAKPGQQAFEVSKVTLHGVTRYPDETFAPLLRSLANRPVTLADVNAVAAQITARYREDGYVLVRTIVPAQRIEAGELVLEVIEGKLNQAEVKGHESRAMRRYIDRLLSEAPLTGATLERYILLTNDLPGNNVSAVLAPSPSVPGTDIQLNNEFHRWDAFVGVDNRSSRYFGPWQFYGGVSVNDPTGLGDQLSVRAGRSVSGNKMTFVEGAYDVPIGSDGLMLSLLGQYNDGNPDVPAWLNANSRGTTFAARLTYPLIRSRAQTLKLSVAFTSFDGRSVYLDEPDLPPSSNDHIRALRFGASWDFVDAYGGRNLLKGELSQGLPGLGASDQDRANPSRLDGRIDFTKLQVDAQRLQDLGAILPGLGVYLAVTAQTSFGQPLLTPEQFGVGGNFFGRGYDPSEIVGDSGVAGKVELEYNVHHRLGNYTVPTQYYAFWDIGRVWNAPPYSIQSESLASVGLGAHITIAKNMIVSPEVAFPLTRPVIASELNGENGKAPRYYVNFIKRF
ncbi:hypothetical protein LJ655_26055 [Paraburkholderia sp. MMS20-SJTN17]|uniref:Hemolysin activation/secretion protein n=1 Tax=Paraburkholderia translucens TaxID=2886945 RepID=A0ABS8KKI5_9BURK|nr:ShlB/FhaC/HecB family hemolysin secretion/activation protein [Paraburkholderia sp. MMS20-SJTN17]MCC8405285.1 hypothetical protein [Paraburkholderia sp. MMS20-SJTN17]